MTELAGIKYLTPELILIGAASVLIVLDLLFKRKEIVAFAGVLGCLAAIFAGAALFVSSDSATGNIWRSKACRLVSTMHCSYWPLPA
jgi:hypothetical protein